MFPNVTKLSEIDFIKQQIEDKVNIDRGIFYKNDLEDDRKLIHAVYEGMYKKKYENLNTIEKYGVEQTLQNFRMQEE